MSSASAAPFTSGPSQGEQVEALGCAERPVGDSRSTNSEGTNISETAFMGEIFLHEGTRHERT
jgi:hypothetical protein